MTRHFRELYAKGLRIGTIHTKYIIKLSEQIKHKDHTSADNSSKDDCDNKNAEPKEP